MGGATSVRMGTSKKSDKFSVAHPLMENYRFIPDSSLSIVTDHTFQHQQRRISQLTVPDEKTMLQISEVVLKYLSRSQ
jgi:hypothetical protein